MPPPVRPGSGCQRGADLHRRIRRVGMSRRGSAVARPHTRRNGRHERPRIPLPGIAEQAIMQGRAREADLEARSWVIPDQRTDRAGHNRRLFEGAGTAARGKTGLGSPHCSVCGCADTRESMERADAIMRTQGAARQTALRDAGPPGPQRRRCSLASFLAWSRQRVPVFQFERADAHSAISA